MSHNQADVAQIARLYREAGVWSDTTGNGFTAELIDGGYLDLMDDALERISYDAVSFEVRTIAQRLARELYNTRRPVALLGWWITPVGKFRVCSRPKFQVDESVYDLLIDAVLDVVSRVPDGPAKLRELINYRPEPEPGPPMKIDTSRIDQHQVTFGALAVGATFLSKGKTYQKISAERDGACAELALEFETGRAAPFDREAKVSAIEASVRIEKYV